MLLWEEPGIVTVVLPDGSSRQVADDVWLPNGMVVLREDTLVLAESHADRLTAWTITDSGELGGRRVWADLGPGSAPDGICADAERAIWYASVPGQRCTRVAEGGEGAGHRHG
jgi:sugar lactone lactonase YvrE